MFLGRSDLAWHSGFVFSVSKLAKRRLQPLVPKQQATDRDNTKNPMQVLKPRDLHLSSFASSNHSAFIQFAASLCRRWSTAPSPESSRHHHSPPKCRASKRAILKKRPSITASSKSCQGDQRASTHSSSSHFLRRAPHLSSLPLTAGPTLRAHSQSLAGCCMARSAVCQTVRTALRTGERRSDCDRWRRSLSVRRATRLRSARDVPISGLLTSPVARSC